MGRLTTQQKFRRWNADLHASLNKYSEADAERDAARLAAEGKFRWYEPVRIDWKEVHASGYEALDRRVWD